MAKVKQLKDKNGTTPVFPVTRDSVVYNDDNEPIKEYTDKIGSGTLTTTSQTIIPAINELKAEVNSLFEEVDNIYYKRVGNIVTCSLPSITGRTIAGWASVAVGTIPQGFIPLRTSYFHLPIQTYSANSIYLCANQNGTLTLINQSGTQTTIGNILATNVSWIH